MHLVVNQVVQLQEVHDTDSNRVFEPVAGTAVAQANLAVQEQAATFFIQIQAERTTIVEVALHHPRVALIHRLGHRVGSHFEAFADFRVGCAVENRCGNVPAQRAASQTQVHFQNLTDVHTRRNTQRVQHDLQRRAIGQEGHVLLAQDAGNDTLVAVTARHLVTDGNLTLLGDVDANHLLYGRGQLIGMRTVENLHIDHNAPFAVRHAQGGIAHLARFFAEDGAHQALFARQLGFTLGRDLADQNVACANLRTDADDAALIEILHRVLADVRDVAGDFVRPQLAFAGFAFKFLHVDGGVNVFLNQLLGQQDGVLVVVAFPVHEADEGIAAQRDFALFGGRAIRQQVILADALTRGNDRALVGAVGLVRAGKLGQVVDVAFAQIVTDDDGVAVHLLDHAVFTRQNFHAGVVTSLEFQTRADIRRFRNEQRHSLTLHVRTHQGAGGVVVFQEGNHARRNGNDLTRRHVDEVNLIARNLHIFGHFADGNHVVDEAVVLIQRLGCRRNAVQVFFVSRHVDVLVGDAAVLLVHAAVRRFNKAVLVDAGVGRQRADQTDVRAFRRFNRADTGIVGIVYVANLEGGAVTVQTAGAQSGQTALVGQFSQRVVLVHELRQLGGTEEFLNRRRHGTDGNQGIGLIVSRAVLRAHALADVALHAAQSRAELILQQFADTAQAAVAEVVNVVRRADAVGQTQQIADGGHHVVIGDVLGHKVLHVVRNHLLELLFFHILAQAVDNRLQSGQVHHFEDADFLGVKGQILRRIHEVVADDDALFAFAVHHNAVDAGVLHTARGFEVNHLTRAEHHFARTGVNNVLSDDMLVDAGGNGQLLIELVAAHAHDVVALGIVEQRLEHVRRALDGFGLVRLLLLVDNQQRLFTRGAHRAAAILACFRHGGVLCHRRFQPLVVAQQIADVVVRFVAQRAQERGQAELAGAVKANPDDVIGVRLVFQPRAAVGDNLAGVERHTRLVQRAGIIAARRTNQLGDDDTVSTVDDERTVFRHQGEIAHVDIGFLDFGSLAVVQVDVNVQRRGVGHIPLAAALHGVLRLTQRIIREGQFQIAVVVGDGRGVCQNLFQVGFEEPLIRPLLHLDQIRHFQTFIDAGEAHAFPELTHCNLMRHDV